jgi:hypothetical protein
MPHGRHPSPHCHADVGRFECRRIINPIPGHCDNFTVSFQGVDQAQFLIGYDACEQVDRPDLMPQLSIVHVIELLSGDDLFRRFQTDLHRNGLRGYRIVAGDHHHPYAGIAAFGDGRRNRRADRI